MTRIRAQINGASVERDVEPRTRLVDFIREDLGLLGTKVSCEVQVCGACTVLVDSQPISSCTYLAVDVDGCDVTTIEGIGDGDRLSSVQQAFIDQSAMQCGFCTAGFIVATTALLNENADPTDEEIAEYLDGNLCRCTGYVQIREAVRQAARARQEESRDG